MQERRVIDNKTMHYSQRGSLTSKPRAKSHDGWRRGAAHVFLKCWKPAALLVASNLLTTLIAHEKRVMRSAQSTDPAYGVVKERKSVSTCAPSLPSSSDLVNDNFRLAFDQSLGYFDDIPHQAWAILRRNAMSTPRYANPSDPNADVIVNDSPSTWLYDNWVPTFSCPRLSKVGGLGDGPKWMCDVDRLARVVERRRLERRREQIWDKQQQQRQIPKEESHISYADEDDNVASEAPEEDCLVYSIGSNGDYSFEDALLAAVGPLCEVHIFDPGNFEKKGLAGRNMFYHKWGLTSSYMPSNLVPGFLDGLNMHSFQEIRAKLGHENRTIDVLKIDCEGCEWITYMDWIGEDIRQVLIETHHLPVPGQNTTYKGVEVPSMAPSDFFDEFEKHGFVLYHREVNSVHSRGRCYEWSFIRLSLNFFQLASP